MSIKQMPAHEMVTWLGLATALLGAGLWLGRLEQRVANIEDTQKFYHGAITLPK